MLKALLALVGSILRSAIALFRSPQDQAIVELALRQQLAVCVHRHPRPRLTPLDRAFWVTLSRIWPRWQSVLVVVQPETVVRWHRRAFRGYWRWISKPGPGRPPVPEETKALIVRVAIENGWRARNLRRGTGNFFGRTGNSIERTGSLNAGGGTKKQEYLRAPAAARHFH